jgi:hypothetical protein
VSLFRLGESVPVQKFKFHLVPGRAPQIDAPTALASSFLPNFNGSSIVHATRADAAQARARTGKL